VVSVSIGLFLGHEIFSSSDFTFYMLFNFIFVIYSNCFLAQKIIFFCYKNILITKTRIILENYFISMIFKLFIILLLNVRDQIYFWSEIRYLNFFFGFLTF
jgi:hypothetical protein